jgi:hypothetical protein
MKHKACISYLFSVVVLLCGCGGGGAVNRDFGGEGQQNPPSNPPPNTPAPVNVQGNWHFTMPIGGEFDPDINIDGSIAHSGTSLTGAVHLTGSDCFDPSNTVNLTGTVSDPNVSFTLAGFEGQFVTVTGTVATYVTGTVATYKLTGTYKIEGGCAGGKEGAATGFRIPTLAGAWRANYGQGYFGSAMISQDSTASPKGSFGLTGTIPDFQCFSGPVVSGTIVPGSLPSPSYISGKAVLIQVKMDDGGTVDIEANASDDGKQIGGFYHYVGGTCDGDESFICFGQNTCFNMNDF